MNGKEKVAINIKRCIIKEEKKKKKILLLRFLSLLLFIQTKANLRFLQE